MKGRYLSKHMFVVCYGMINELCFLLEEIKSGTTYLGTYCVGVEGRADVTVYFSGSPNRETFR